MTNPLEFGIDVSRVVRFAQLAILFSPIFARIITLLCHVDLKCRVHGLPEIIRNFLTTMYTSRSLRLSRRVLSRQGIFAATFIDSSRRSSIIRNL